LNTKVFIMAGLAVAFGAVSYLAGNSWLESQAQARLDAIKSEKQPAMEMATVVVASVQVRFGQRLTPENLKEVPWPADAVPQGAFRKVGEITDKGERKAIKTIEPNEPVLAVKITGENGRAGLAGIISEGMRAVTIPVDLVNGVGGFVMPGDRVDIVLTRRDEENGTQEAKIIMENVKVLSIDQDADRTDESARVAKSVTLETDAPGAQKLALANSVGRLSLLLRSAGDEDKAGTGTLSAQDFDDAQAAKPAAGKEDDGLFGFLNAKPKKQFTTISVVKREEVIQHTVPATGADNAATSGQ
jgi:pilus assembly protein CpaB